MVDLFVLSKVNRYLAFLSIFAHNYNTFHQISIYMSITKSVLRDAILPKLRESQNRTSSVFESAASGGLSICAVSLPTAANDSGTRFNFIVEHQSASDSGVCIESTGRLRDRDNHTINLAFVGRTLAERLDLYLVDPKSVHDDVNQSSRIAMNLREDALGKALSEGKLLVTLPGSSEIVAKDENPAARAFELAHRKIFARYKDFCEAVETPDQFIALAFKLEVAAAIAHKLSHDLFWKSVPPLRAKGVRSGLAELRSIMIEGVVFDPAFAVLDLLTNPHNISLALAEFDATVRRESARVLLYSIEDLRAFFKQSNLAPHSSNTQITLEQIMANVPDSPAEFIDSVLFMPQDVVVRPNFGKKLA